MNTNINSDDLLNLIKFRRSVRLFNGVKIDNDDVLSVLEAGTWAPTGCNNQEIKYAIIEKENELTEMLKFKPFFQGVSHIIIVLCDMSLPMSKRMYQKNIFERHLPYIDTGLAMSNITVFAKSKGIDSCIFNLSEHHFKRIKNLTFIKKIISKIKIKLKLHHTLENNFEYFLRNFLKVPKHYRIMCGIALGYAKRFPDIQKEIHGGKKVMREKVEHYILSR